MARVQTIVQLSTDLLQLLDQEAARRGVSRSALVRRALEDFLRDEREAAISRQIVEGYRRIPPATPDEWGNPEATSEQATGDLLRRLDSEERRQGHEPW